MQHNEFHRWLIDPRYFYVWFWSHQNAFENGSAGPCLAVTDDFGSLVPVDA